MATTTTPVSEATYRELALGNKRLELHRGQLREKPLMSVAHDRVIDRLLRQLYVQLGPHDFAIRSNSARLRRSADTYYIPDVAVIPAVLEQTLFEHPRILDAYTDPLPLVVEIWSPSTGSYDIRAKLPDYQQRGDLEIWFIHPYEKTLTAWRRQPDGAYVETVHQGGVVRVASLSGIAINLDELFAD